VIKTALLSTNKSLNLPSTITKRDKFLEDFRDAYAIIKEAMGKDPNNEKVAKLFNSLSSMFYYTMELEHSEDMAHSRVKETQERLVEIKIKYEELLFLSKK
jgi:hypothetical protein